DELRGDRERRRLAVGEDRRVVRLVRLEDGEWVGLDVRRPDEVRLDRDRRLVRVLLPVHRGIDDPVRDLRNLVVALGRVEGRGVDRGEDVGEEDATQNLRLVEELLWIED